MPTMTKTESETGQLIEYEAISAPTETIWARTTTAWFFEENASVWYVPWFYRSPFSKGLPAAYSGAGKSYTCRVFSLWDRKAECTRYVEEYREWESSFFYGSWKTKRAELTKNQARHWFAMVGVRNPPTNIIEV